ncbi:MFS transporter, partial [Asanoa sp. NPDC050611]|uniref:MFS transporter n=1 Tax=Asanoa sp. NPDC050611 TaxID=3157098 RepID=UPI00340539DC
AHRLGLVFTGWGLLVALFSVFFAPRLQARFGTAKVLYVNLAALGVVMAVIGAGVSTPSAVIVAVIVSGAFIGINNTLTTQAVMLVAPVERPVASSAYGFVRFIGGGLAPFVAGKLADAWSLSVPFYLGGVTFVLAIAVLATGHRLLGEAERGLATPAPAARLEPVGPTAAGRPVVVAVGATPDAPATVDAAAGVARDRGAPLEVVHVRETVVVEELAVDPEPLESARAALAAHLDRLAAAGIAASGQLLHSVGDHATAARVLAAHASDVDARTVVVGPSPRGPVAQFTDGSFTAALTAAATVPVLLLRPDEQPRELTPTALAELRPR